MPQKEAKNELFALFREEITTDIKDVNKTCTKKIKSTSEAHLRDKEAYLRKRRTSNEINITESPEPFVTEIYQQIAAQTNVTEINANKKNKSNNLIETEAVKFKTILTTLQKTSLSIHCAKNSIKKFILY